MRRRSKGTSFHVLRCKVVQNMCSYTHAHNISNYIMVFPVSTTHTYAHGFIRSLFPRNLFEKPWRWSAVVLRHRSRHGPRVFVSKGLQRPHERAQGRTRRVRLILVGPSTRFTHRSLAIVTNGTKRTRPSLNPFLYRSQSKPIHERFRTSFRVVSTSRYESSIVSRRIR